MPIYEYVCDTCRNRFEKKQRFFDDAVAQCPQCQSSSRRVFSVGAVIYKGSGFYITDTRQEKESRNRVNSEKDVSASTSQASNQDQ